MTERIKNCVKKEEQWRKRYEEKREMSLKTKF